MGPALRRVISTKVYALGQIWAKWGQGTDKPIADGPDWAKYERSAGGLSKEFLSEKGSCKIG